jgi:predicted exporter
MLGGVCMSGLISGELNLFSILTLFIILILSIDASIFRCDYRQCSSNPIFFGTIITSFIFLMLSFSEITLLDSISRILFFGILISYLSGFIMFSDKNNDTVSE